MFNRMGMDARRRVASGLLACGALLTLFPTQGMAHNGDDHSDGSICPCCVSVREASELAAKSRRRTLKSSNRLTKIGFLRISGFNADVWAHEGYAYVGDENAGSRAGVAIVDVRKPSSPKLLGRVAGIPNTTQEDVMVKRINTAAFQGNLLVTGIQAKTADTVAPRGIDLWDVTNPRKPKHLAFWSSGAAQAGVARGVHELFLFQRGDRAYVAGMVPESEERGGPGDLRLVDVTDPRNPVQVGEWGAFKDGGLPPQKGSFPWGHSVTVNAAGTQAITSFWDAGNIFLDITDPAHPTFQYRIAHPAGPDGNTHSITLAQSESLMLVSDENLEALPDDTPWGYLRVWEIGTLSNAAKVGEYATADAAALPAKENGLFSIHNTVARGNTVFASWYSDGVRAIDISNPAAPLSIGSYVPAGALIWGIHEDRGLIFASDINQGLYILKLK